MMRPSVKVWGLLLAAVASSLLWGCRPEGATGAKHVGLLELAPIPAQAPIAFFDRSCAGCHGPIGRSYGESFAAGRDDAALTRVVREMVAGPGRSVLDETSLLALVAFHRALRDRPGRPFVAITAVGEARIDGEVSPGARVEVVLGGKSIEAVVDFTNWTAALPAHWREAGELRVRASMEGGGLVTELDPAARSYSHAE